MKKRDSIRRKRFKTQSGVHRRRSSTEFAPKEKVCCCCGIYPVKSGNYFLCIECFINPNRVDSESPVNEYALGYF